jgi:hypothetical protein
MSPNAGGRRGVAGSQPMRTAVHTGAQINFGDRTPYFTYAKQSLSFKHTDSTPFFLGCMSVYTNKNERIFSSYTGNSEGNGCKVIDEKGLPNI